MFNNVNKWKIDGTTITVNVQNLAQTVNAMHNATTIMWWNDCGTYTAAEATAIVIRHFQDRMNGLEIAGRADGNTIRAQSEEIFELKKRVSALEQGATVTKERDYAISKQEARALLSAFDGTTLPYKAEGGRYCISRVLYNLLKAAQYDSDTLCELFGVCRAHTAGYGIQSTRLYTDNNEYFFEYTTYSSCD